ncbi:MAG: hypothetical protein V7603_4802 [Micromonosporaceae bacterium]
MGAGRREVARLIDAIVRVQSDADEIERRNPARVAAGEADPVNSAVWMADEFRSSPISEPGSEPR